MEEALGSLIFHCMGLLAPQQPFLLVPIGTVGSLERRCWVFWSQNIRVWILTLPLPSSTDLGVLFEPGFPLLIMEITFFAGVYVMIKWDNMEIPSTQHGFIHIFLLSFLPLLNPWALFSVGTQQILIEWININSYSNRYTLSKRPFPSDLIAQESELRNPFLTNLLY